MSVGGYSAVEILAGFLFEQGPDGAGQLVYRIAVLTLRKRDRLRVASGCYFRVAEQAHIYNTPDRPVVETTTASECTGQTVLFTRR